MRPTTFFTLALLASLLVGCTPDTAPLNPTAEIPIDARSSDDCPSYDELLATSATCEDFSSCADLAGKRSFSFTTGIPPMTTGQQPNEPVGLTLGLCGNPLAGHPFSFSFSRTGINPAAVITIPRLGRMQQIEFYACVRPYLDPATTGPIPFPLPGYVPPEDPADFPYDLYPACNDITGSITFVAANGDELSIVLEADAFTDCANPELYTVVGQWEVIGGTGRFDDATGGGCITGSGPANPFAPAPGVPDFWQYEGGIDY
jgi:hypothetical protein